MINWKIEKRKLSELKAWDKNPRTISKVSLEKLKDRIKQRGFHDILKITPQNIVLSGNQRLTVLREMDIDEVDVKVPDRNLNQKEMEEIAIESNISDGSWDINKLANEFEQEMLADLGFKNILKQEEDFLPQDSNTKLDDKEVKLNCPHCGKEIVI